MKLAQFDPVPVEREISYLGARLREPSTYNAVSILFGIMGINLDPGLAHGLMLIGSGIGAVIGFLLPEGLNK